MHTDNLGEWTHDHVFDQDRKRAGENRTLMIVILTAVMMIIEITTGLISGSMALLADGLHMASHATALGIAVLAYVMSRRLAADARFAFGVGKINSLAGFGSAVLLLGFAAVMATESVGRLISPMAIAFDQALVVAALGLVVNAVSAWVLASTPHETHGHDHHDRHHDHHHAHHHEGTHDHNLRGAYLHVLADALTSLLAIFALLAGKFLGATWMDPAMGIVGAVLVSRWSLGLIRDSGRVLLDTQVDPTDLVRIRDSLESDSTDRVTDLHVWLIGHGIYAAEVSIVSDDPLQPADYRLKMSDGLNVVHATVEVNRCKDHEATGGVVP